MPDYIFSGRAVYDDENQMVFWTEFKAPGKTPTENQLDEQKHMTNAGWDGFNCDDFAKFKHWVLEYEKENAYP